jgi:hypothetical protein
MIGRMPHSPRPGAGLIRIPLAAPADESNSLRYQIPQRWKPVCRQTGVGKKIGEDVVESPPIVSLKPAGRTEYFSRLRTRIFPPHPWEGISGMRVGLVWHERILPFRFSIFQLPLDPAFAFITRGLGNPGARVDFKDRLYPSIRQIEQFMFVFLPAKPNFTEGNLLSAHRHVLC